MSKRTRQGRANRRRSSDQSRTRASGDAERPRIKVRGPEDFVAIVPYLLGFHPTDSVVAVFFDGGRVALTARMDLPGSPGAPPTLGVLAEEIAVLAERVRAPSLVLVCYTDAPERRLDLEWLARDERLQPIEALQVGPQRWWSLLCTQPDCCPTEGTPYELSGHPLCAEAVLAGMTTVPDRDAVAELVAGPPAADIGRLEGLGAHALLILSRVARPERKQLMQQTVEKALINPTELTDAECAGLAALTVDLEVRDVAWVMMTREDAEQHLALWRRVVSRTVEWLSPGPLGLESAAAWLTGNGALLNCGMERLETLSPEYGLLGVLRDIGRRALPPSAWDDLAPAMRAELDLLVPS